MNGVFDLKGITITKEFFKLQKAEHGTKPAFTPPFRLGKKQKRAVLDANGLEVVVFAKGLESYAHEYVDFLNSKTS